MKSELWFLCGRKPETASFELAGLRSRLKDLYDEGVTEEYSLVVAEATVNAEGFDRLAIRLSYTRILTEVTANPALLAGTGLAITLIRRDDNLPATLAKLRKQLGDVTAVARPPQVWLERLPPQYSMAVELLDELSR